MDLITNFDQVTPQWLSGVLGQPVSTVEQQQGQSEMARNAMLQLHYGEAAASQPEKLFLKLNDRAAEGRFYHHIAPAMPDAPLLKCYHAGYRDDPDASHLLLQYVEASHFVPPEALPMPLKYCEAIIDLLAEIHAFWWEHPRLKGDIGAMAEDVPAFLLSIASGHFGHFVDYLGDRLSDVRRGYLETILGNFPKYRPKSPKTLVHGDTHWWNFLYPHDLATGRLYIIDWAVWNINFGISDVAYTLAQQCTPERRALLEQPLVRRYHEGLQRGVSQITLGIAAGKIIAAW